MSENRQTQIAGDAEGRRSLSLCLFNKHKIKIKGLELVLWSNGLSCSLLCWHHTSQQLLESHCSTSGSDPGPC